MSEDRKWFVDDASGYASLTKITDWIRCSHCEFVLGMVGEGILMFKTVITLVDQDNGQIYARCGKCRKYTTVTIKND